MAADAEQPALIVGSAAVGSQMSRLEPLSLLADVRQARSDGSFGARAQSGLDRRREGRVVIPHNRRAR